MPPSTEYLMKVKLELQAQQLEQQLKTVQGKLDDLGGGSSFTSLSSGFLGVAGAVTAVVGEVTVLTGAISAASVELFNLEKQASDLGRSFGSFETKTGLSATAVSTLAFAAKASNKELSDLQRPMVFFNETLYKAASGSDTAQAALKRMGVTSYDLNTALDQLTKGSNASTNAQQRLHDIVTILGKRGGPDLISVLAKMPDGFKAAQREAERLGMTLSEDDIRAAKEFGKVYDTISTQIEIGVTKFALSYGPQITNTLKSISQFLGENKELWHQWGSTIGSAVSFALKSLAGIVYFIKDHPIATRVILGVATTGMSEALFQSLSTIEGLEKGSGGGTINNQNYEVVHSKYDKPLKPPFDLDDLDTGGNGGGKIKRPPKESDDAFRKFFEENGFTVNRTFGGAINAGSPHTYGGAADLSVKAKTIDDIFDIMVKSIEKGYRIVDESGRNPAPGIKRTGPNIHVENAKTTLTKSSIFTNEQFTPEQIAYLRSLDAERLGKTPEGKLNAFTEKAQADTFKASMDELDAAKKILDEWVASEKDAMNQTLTIRRSEADMAEEILKGQLDQGIISEYDYTKTVGQLHVAMLEDEKKRHEELLPKLSDEKEIAEEKNKIAQLDLAIETAKLKKENDILTVLRKQTEEINKAVKKNARPGNITLQKRTPHSGGGIGSGILGGLGAHDDMSIWTEIPDAMGNATKVMKTKADYMKDIYDDLAKSAGGAIGSMINGLAQMGAQWLITGEFSAKAALSMIASTALSIGTQAGYQGIMEIAEASKESALAAASLAIGDVAGAALHTTAAGMHSAAASTYFTVAAIAGGVGVGAGLGARAAGGGSGGGGGKGSGAATYTQQQPQNQTLGTNQQLGNFTRSGNAVWMNGQQVQARAVQQLASSVDALHAKIEGFKPGDVLGRGIRERPGLVSTTNLNEHRADASKSRALAKTIGLK